MPERNAYSALSKATNIGPDPTMQALHDSPLTRAEMPLDPDFLRSLGKPLSELLGLIFKSPTGSGIPSKLRVTNWDAKAGQAALHGLRKGSERFSASPSQIDELVNTGTIGIQQPPQSAVDAIRRKLSALLGSQ